MASEFNPWPDEIGFCNSIRTFDVPVYNPSTLSSNLENKFLQGFKIFYTVDSLTLLIYVSVYQQFIDLIPISGAHSLNSKSRNGIRVDDVSVAIYFCFDFRTWIIGRHSFWNNQKKIQSHVCSFASQKLGTIRFFTQNISILFLFLMFGILCWQSRWSSSNFRGSKFIETGMHKKIICIFMHSHHYLAFYYLDFFISVWKLKNEYILKFWVSFKYFEVLGLLEITYAGYCGLMKYRWLILLYVYFNIWSPYRWLLFG